jgi:hypothetical protein
VIKEHDTVLYVRSVSSLCRRLGIRKCCALVLVPMGIATTADAHFAPTWTGDASYNCTLSVGQYCWHDGDSVGEIGGFGSGIDHSYAFVSADNNQTTGRRVCGTIYWPGVLIDEECGNNFRRNCWDAWNHSSDELDCHDQDGTSFKSGAANSFQSSSSANITGHTRW